VALYWVVTTIFSIVQQYYVNKEHLRLRGVMKSLDEVEKKHPEHKKKQKKLKKNKGSGKNHRKKRWFR
jgi:membrane protein insertase Oxa1/YidC/SpoIIIJ